MQLAFATAAAATLPSALGNSRDFYRTSDLGSSIPPIFGLGRDFSFFLIYPGASVYLFCCMQRFVAAVHLAAGRSLHGSTKCPMTLRLTALRHGNSVKSRRSTHDTRMTSSGVDMGRHHRPVRMLRKTRRPNLVDLCRGYSRNDDDSSSTQKGDSHPNHLISSIR